MATGIEDSTTATLGEINKYDFRTNTPSVFKSRMRESSPKSLR